jgi:hypothetical protein
MWIIVTKRIKKSPVKLKFYRTFLGLLNLLLLRRERDSNPRNLSVQRFSRPPQSTTLPSLLKTCAKVQLFLKCKNLLFINSIAESTNKCEFPVVSSFAPSSHQGRTFLAPCLHQPCIIIAQILLWLRFCIPHYMRQRRGFVLHRFHEIRCCYS